MPRNDNKKRAYNAPQRAKRAAQTRLRVVQAAKRTFEKQGWAATTIREISEQARVSPKTVEALHGTKVALLSAVVNFAIRGDLDPRPMIQREQIAAMNAAPDAPTMLDLHASHIRITTGRSAAIAWVVEQAAHDDRVAATVWRRMNRNRRFGIDWAARTLLAKPGLASDVTLEDARRSFWVAFDWANYRTLTRYAGLTADEFEDWLRSYYRWVFLRPGPGAVDR